MNPRQRRAVLLLGLAVAGLIGVFALVANYVSDVETQVGDKIVVLELTRRIPADTAIDDTMVRQKIVPRRWAPPTALTDVSQLTGGVAAGDLEPNSILQEGMLARPPSIEEGQREASILVDASTGVSGRIRPGDLVDVIASYSAEAVEGQKPRPARSLVIVPGAEVIAIGQPRVRAPSGVPEAQQENPSEVVPITFAVDKRQSLKVAHAQTFASDVRLALLRPGDPSDRTLGETIFRGRDPRELKDGSIR